MTNTTPSQQKTDYLYAYDVHGDVSPLINEGNGNVKESYGYDPYGRMVTLLRARTPATTRTPFNPYRYSGRRLDSGSQTYDMAARRFGPDVDHFLQVDLFQGALSNLTLSLDPLTQDRYALAPGNPIAYQEWDGHRVEQSGGSGALTPNPQQQQYRIEGSRSRARGRRRSLRPTSQPCDSLVHAGGIHGQAVPLVQPRGSGIDNLRRLQRCQP